MLKPTATGPHAQVLGRLDDAEASFEQATTQTDYAEAPATGPHAQR